MMPPPPPRRSHMVGVIDKLASLMPKDRPWCGPHPAKFIYRLHKTCIATPGTDERYNNDLNILHSPSFHFHRLWLHYQRSGGRCFRNKEQKDANKT